MALVNNILTNKNIHRFSHNAMNTIFEIIIELKDRDYAEQAANAAFYEIDKLEEELSRFQPNSEISKINSLKREEKLNLSLDVFECLQIAKNIYDITNGLFDITSGKIIDYWKKNNDNIDLRINSKSIGMHKVNLNKDNFSLTLLSDNLNFDLGGLGKGFAIDKVSELLVDWEIENSIIHSGSTVKAIGNLTDYEGWPITISNPLNISQSIAEIMLVNNSISGSGKQKGTHIINPRTFQPEITRSGAWALTESAAVSDAMSTTFMIMSYMEIAELTNNHNYISGLIIKDNIDLLTTDNIFITENFNKEYLLI